MTDIKVASVNKGDSLDVFKAFLILGLSSFGGPVAHIGYFHKEFVERRAWVSEGQFSQLLAICQFLPGPASSQLGFSLGLLRAGWQGSIAAFIGFTLPSALLLLGFASVLTFLSGDIGSAAIHGLKLVACAVVADAVLGMSKKLCSDTPRRTIAILAASILLVSNSAWAQIIVVLGGAVFGLFFCRGTALDANSQSDSHIRVSYGMRESIVILGIFLFVFAGLAWGPFQSELLSIANVFYQAGTFVFGGGHVVLPLLEDSTVATGWVSEQDFLAGYGASQAIPGPMFAFSAYLGALIPTEHASWLGASIALLFMFLPGFLLLAAILPMWQAVSHNEKAISAISGVNAVVVGLLAAALYNPIFTSGIASGVDLAIALVAFAMLNIWRLSPLFAVLWCVGASLFAVMI